jgi:ABC-type transporter Mla subunit MlaD
MRRLLGLALLLSAGAAVLVGANGGGESASRGYRVDAVFDRTAALIPGQQVKVAGAPIGSVKDIKLTPERKARVQMDVQEDFGPFRADARCVIRAEALIGEKFVQCDPGTPQARPLRGRDGEAPTVRLERNTTPVEIDTILATFRRPYRERLRILLNEFGMGLAGRSDDLDAVIRRSNPALREANDLLRILDRERASLGRLVEGTDAALAELASRRGEVQSFIERADAVTQATASRSGDLQEAIRRLPPLLAEAEPSAERLGAFARDATPAVRQLRLAAPAVNRLLEDVEPLTDATVPALRRLSRTARIGRRAVRAARPVARRLQLASRELPDVVRTTTGLVENLRARGGVEHLLSFVYYAAAAAARFDSISHMLPAFAVVNDCGEYATAPNPGCVGGKFGGGGAVSRDTKARRRVRRRAGGGEGRAPAAPRPAPRTAPPQRRAPDRGRRGRRPLLPGLPVPPPVDPDDPGSTGVPLLDYLLG